MASATRQNGASEVAGSNGSEAGTGSVFGEEAEFDTSPDHIMRVLADAQ